MRVAPVSSVAFLLLLPCLAAAQQAAPSGAAVYKQRCAGCHDGSLPGMPSRQALGAMSPEHIESELASFSMRRQGASLSPAERRAVAEFLTGRPAGSYRAPIAIIPKSAYCTAACCFSQMFIKNDMNAALPRPLQRSMGGRIALSQRRIHGHKGRISRRHHPL